jgi:hypothetical protein
VVQSVKDNLLAAMRHVFRPLCRIALRNGIQFGDLALALQDALAGAARAELKAGGIGEASDEEVGLMTGMDIASVRAVKQMESNSVEGLSVSRAASEVLSGWHTDPKYSGPYGLVLDIPFSSANADKSHGGRSFEALVHTYAGRDVSARVVLDELVKSNNVQNFGDGILRSLTRTYIAERLSPENIQAFAEAVHNVIGTMAVNLKRTVPGTGLMQRTVFADYGLTEENLAKFNVFIRKVGDKLADEVDTWFANHSSKDHHGPISTGFGFYHYVEDDEDRENYLARLQRERTQHGH